MNQIEKIAIETYNQNILYIMKNHPKLADDLQNLDLAIQQGIYEEEYALEYVNENFDIKELKKNVYTYDKQSLSFVKNISKLINLDKSSGTIEGFSIHDISKFTVTNPEAIEEKKEVYDLMAYSVNNISKSNTFKKIRKFIFIGVGLGLHISDIHKKYHASDYLIVEDNLEIFKLSLFTTKYYEIAQKSRISFAVLEDDTNFNASINTFLQNNFAYNHFMKYIRINNHSGDKIRLIQTAIANQSFMIFPYRKRLEMNIAPLTYLREDYQFLNLSSIIKNDFFSTKPVLVLAAGPSFEANIEWLIQNHAKYIVISVSAVLPTLFKHNIKPDIVTHLDGQELAGIFYEGYNAKEFLKDSICIFSAATHKKIITTFSKEQIYCFENITNYHKNYSVLTTECVGSFSYVLSLILGAQEIYLLGLDLALNQTTGATHSNQHGYNQVIELPTSNNASQSTSLRNTTLEVEGNFTQTVLTNALYHASLSTLQQGLPFIVTPEQKVYNFSDGAKIDYAQPLKTGKERLFTSLDKKDFKASIHMILKDYSASTLSQEELQLLKVEETSILRMKGFISNFKTTHNNKDVDKYVNDLINLLISIIKEGESYKSALIDVYSDYFQYILSIVEDFFNTQGSNNVKHHIKNMNKIIEIGLDNIQERYETELVSFLQSRQ